MNELMLEDAEVFDLIDDEYYRQKNGIELIASENYCSPAVMQAQGSCLTWKYAEGLPNNRYYGGCDNVDKIETICMNRALKVFECDEGEYAVNVQPHSGAQANMAGFMTVLSQGDTILGMELNAGGHLTHGFKANFSGKFFNAVNYGLTPEGDIDYEQVQRLAEEHKPKLIVAGASAFSGKIDWAMFRKIADSVGAYLMADIAHYAGLIAGGVYPSPFGYADIVTTTTHKTLRGPRGGLIFAKKELERKMNSAVFPGCQGGPLEHVIAAKAVCLGEALRPSFKAYARAVVSNTSVMAKMFVERGFDVVGYDSVHHEIPSHVFLLDLRKANITGDFAQDLFEVLGITTNKNMIPNDPQPSSVCSGLRIGAAAATTRGFTRIECAALATVMAELLLNPNDINRIKVSGLVKYLTEKHPLMDIA